MADFREIGLEHIADARRRGAVNFQIAGQGVLRQAGIFPA
jgi:hypothetical protein